MSFKSVVGSDYNSPWCKRRVTAISLNIKPTERSTDRPLACLIRPSIPWRCSGVQSTPRLVPSIRLSKSVTSSDELPPEGLPLPAAGCTSDPDSGFSIRTDVSRVALWRAACTASNKNNNNNNSSKVYIPAGIKERAAAEPSKLQKI